MLVHNNHNIYDEAISEKLQTLKDSGQYRYFSTINRIKDHYPMAYAKDIDKEVIVWCSNDYLGMSQHTDVINSMHEAIDSYGAGSGGSRNIGGTHEEYLKLESSLANWHQKEKALVFPTGYSSNDATLQCLLRLFPDMIVYSDEKKSCLYH